MQPAGSPAEEHCANCAAALATGQQYCGACGQSAPTRRLRSADVAAELVLALANVDHSVLSLLRDLFLRPGHVAREYVEGHRKRYFGPFAFLIVVVGLATVVMQTTNYLVITSRHTGGATAATAAIANFLQQHVNLLILLQVPVMAGLCTIFFRSAKLNYAEHAVLAAYLACMRSIFFMVVIIPLWYLLQAWPPVTALPYAYLLLWTLYFGFGASQFYPGRAAWNGLKGFLVAVLTQTTVVALVTAFTFLYFQLND